MATGNRFFCNKVLNEFEEQLRISNSLAALRSMMHSSLSSLGFGAYAYARIAFEPNMHPKIQVLTNYPHTWCERYKSANYSAIDPTLWYCESQTTPVAWHEMGNTYTQKNMASLLFEEARSYGLCYGITVPLHGGDRWVSAMNIVTDLPLNEAIRQIAALRDMVHIMSILFHGKAKKHIRSSVMGLTWARSYTPPIGWYDALKSKRGLH